MPAQDQPSANGTRGYPDASNNAPPAAPTTESGSKLELAHIGPGQEVPASVQPIDRWQADQILPGLYLGNAASASSLPHLRKQGITHVVNVTFSANCFPEDLCYLQIPIEDDMTADLLPHLDSALDFMHGVLTSNAGWTPNADVDPAAASELSLSATCMGERCVLVHCREGDSRSVSVALAYLMRYRHLTLDAALRFLQVQRREEARSAPNSGFLNQLLRFEALASREIASVIEEEDEDDLCGRKRWPVGEFEDMDRSLEPVDDTGWLNEAPWEQPVSPSTSRSSRSSRRFKPDERPPVTYKRMVRGFGRPSGLAQTLGELPPMALTDDFIASLSPSLSHSRIIRPLGQPQTEGELPSIGFMNQAALSPSDTESESEFEDNSA